MQAYLPSPRGDLCRGITKICIQIALTKIRRLQFQSKRLLDWLDYSRKKNNGEYSINIVLCFP